MCDLTHPAAANFFEKLLWQDGVDSRAGVRERHFYFIELVFTGNMLIHRNGGKNNLDSGLEG